MYVICMFVHNLFVRRRHGNNNNKNNTDCKTKIKRGACHVRVQQVKLCFLFGIFSFFFCGLSKNCCWRINFNFCTTFCAVWCYFLIVFPFNERLFGMFGIRSKKTKVFPIGLLHNKLLKYFQSISITVAHLLSYWNYSNFDFALPSW